MRVFSSPFYMWKVWLTISQAFHTMPMRKTRRNSFHMLFCILIEFYLNFVIATIENFYVSSGGWKKWRKRFRNRLLWVNAVCSRSGVLIENGFVRFRRWSERVRGWKLDNKCMIVYYIGMEDENLRPVLGDLFLVIKIFIILIYLLRQPHVWLHNETI